MSKNSILGDEIELKLEMTPGDADALEACAVLQGSPEIARQRSVYFDTPDRTLAKMGYSLRIRRTGNKRIQTVKADGATSAGLFARSEWEQPVKGAAPILDYTTPILALVEDAVDAIGPVFEVHIERRTWIIDEDGSKIELALDRGEVIFGDRRSAICEIELELKSGDPASLFTLARRINAAVPVQLGVLSKAERGYNLTLSSDRAVRAKPVVLASGMTAGEAFQAIVQNCVRQFRLNEMLLMVARDAPALHQARVALRRLRSAFAVFKPLISVSTGPALLEELRWLSGELGAARDLDVLLARSKPGPLHDGILAAREAAYDRVGTALRSLRVRALMLNLAEWTVAGDWLQPSTTEVDRPQSVRDLATHALDRLRRKVKKGSRGVGSTNDEARHGVRKDAKKLRYAAEFFVSLFPSKRERRRFKKFIAALEELQKHLGALNDIATAPQLLEQFKNFDERSVSKLLGKGKKKALIEAAGDAHDDLMDVKRFWR